MLLSGGGSGKSYILSHPAEMFEGAGRAAFEAAREAWRTKGGWLAGLLHADCAPMFDAAPAWPDAPEPTLLLARYDAAAVFDHQAQTLSMHGDLGATIPAAKALGKHPLPPPTGPVGATIKPRRPQAEVEAIIARAVEYVRAGDVFQVNVSQGFDAVLAPDDTPFAAFQRLVMASPAPYAGYCALDARRPVITHSPEQFFALSADGAAVSKPIKGTRPRGRTPEEDAAYRRALTASEKDRAENLMIVDLMRNDFARVCEPGSVRAPQLCALESYANVHHLVSTVTGTLGSGLDVFDLLEASFPPGSVTGAPKIRAQEIIAELEGEPRGPYCGALGLVEPNGASRFNVMIRSIAFDRAAEQWRARFRSGGGIVIDSDPAAEYAETLDKAASILSALKPDRA